MFPIDSAAGGYDADLLARFNNLAAARGCPVDLAALLPRVLPAANLQEALEAAVGQGTALFFYEAGQGSLRQALQAAGDRLFLFVGPEGGFAPEEAELARSLGAEVLTLGRRILRTETAPLAALSAIFYEKGDMEL